MPTPTEYDDVLIHPGRYFTAEWYYTADGRSPAFEHYESMTETDRDRFDDMIRYLCETRPGSFLPKTLYRIEDHSHQIYALKPREERFFNFMTTDAKIIITNAYHKHSQQMTKADIRCLRAAIGYKQDYLRRVKREAYYED